MIEGRFLEGLEGWHLTQVLMDLRCWLKGDREGSVKRKSRPEVDKA